MRGMIRFMFEKDHSDSTMRKDCVCVCGGGRGKLDSRDHVRDCFHNPLETL